VVPADGHAPPAAESTCVSTDVMRMAARSMMPLNDEEAGAATMT
jgi:hypothetical protein